MARGNRQDNGIRKPDMPKAKLTKENLKEAFLIFNYLKPYRWTFVTGLLFIALSSGTTMAFPYFLKKLIDSAHSLSLGKDAVAPGTIALWMLGILTLQMIFSFMRVYLFIYLCGRVCAGGYAKRRLSKNDHDAHEFLCPKKGRGTIEPHQRRSFADPGGRYRYAGRNFAWFAYPYHWHGADLCIITRAGYRNVIGGTGDCYHWGCIWKTHQEIIAQHPGSAGRFQYHCSGNTARYKQRKIVYQ